MDDKAIESVRLGVRLIECVRLGVRLRDTQVAFFRSLDRAERAKLLGISKKLEREFDTMAKYVLALVDGQKPSP